MIRLKFWRMIIIAFIFFGSIVLVRAAACQALDEDVDPSRLRTAWAAQELPAEQKEILESLEAPYILNAEERGKFKGTFGADLSHHNFDIKRKPTLPKCRTPEGYLDVECSCTFDWDAAHKNGLKLTYLKASEGAGQDLSFSRNWKTLERLHEKGAMFRGAYHFLRPDRDADTQANTFLSAIGAVGGKRPKQLPPVLDIEWVSREVRPEDPETADCPADRQTKANGTTYCDMWYKLSPEKIVSLAKRWIEVVEGATDRKVMIYTNAGAWWDPVVGSKGAALLEKRPIWPSRYSSTGPIYNPKWTAQGGSEKWRMPPLPKPATYPVASYNVGHVWQFSENGGLEVDLFKCGGKSENRKFDLNWIPVQGQDLSRLLAVK